MQEDSIITIEKQAAKLSLHEHIKLVEALTHQLREKSLSAQQKLEWDELYGLGKGLWNNEDAQNYVNRLREERT
ncbi:MAG: hypothetical protein KJP23_04225 [Deltaproteobacteria bacterium]|nr:hypothetical protein [Deltaproteobacteria bacterium]